MPSGCSLTSNTRFQPHLSPLHIMKQCPPRRRHRPNPVNLPAPTPRLVSRDWRHLCPRRGCNIDLYPPLFQPPSPRHPSSYIPQTQSTGSRASRGCTLFSTVAYFLTICDLCCFVFILLGRIFPPLILYPQTLARPGILLHHRYESLCPFPRRTQ
jgi:hypothetical protein